MKKALFYDTETTGMVLWKEPSEHPDQPHIVQIAAKLVDLDTRRVLGRMSHIIRPDGWTIPDEVVRIHGITTEMAMDCGIAAVDALSIFRDMCGVLAGGERIAFNESFDARIIRIALKRMPQLGVDPDRWKDMPSYCPMRPAQKIMGVGKFPRLTEAYAFFTGGASPKDAHDAWGDVEMLEVVYDSVMARTGAAVAPEPPSQTPLALKQWP